MQDICMCCGYFRNAEKRKEKSRDAARSRRGKEADVFAELSDILPVAHETLASMDKASVMRIAISNVKLLTLLSKYQYQARQDTHAAQ